MDQLDLPSFLPPRGEPPEVATESAGQALDVAVVYALELFARCPAHWVRNGTVTQLVQWLHEMPDDKQRRVLQRTAKRHINTLLPRKY